MFVLEFSSGVSVGVRLEGVRINDAFLEDDFVSFGFFDCFLSFCTGVLLISPGVERTKRSWPFRRPRCARALLEMRQPICLTLLVAGDLMFSRTFIGGHFKSIHFLAT